MKIKNKILIWIIFIILSSCSKFQKGGVDETGLDMVEVEVPYFGKLYTFDFYGREITIKINPSIVADLDLESNDTAQIRELVKNLKDKNFDKTVKMLIDQAKEMELDAFGYRLLLKKFVEEILEDKSKNFGEVIMWYGLRTNDLDAILSKKGKRIFCYSSGWGYYFVRDKTDETNRGMMSLNIENTGYWNDNKNINPENQDLLLSFDLFPKSKHCDFIFSKKLPKLGKKIFSKKRSFVYKGRVYQLKTSYNKYFVQYLNSLPMRGLGREYFKIEFSKETTQSFDSIPMWINGKTNDEKFSFLLTLVDQAFPHSGGDKIEKWNYVEQTMKDDYVDCEDRAIMFCYLTERFTDSKAALVLNDGHAWGAVLNQKSYKYTMCDPGLKLGQMLEPNKKFRIIDP